MPSSYSSKDFLEVSKKSVFLYPLDLHQVLSDLSRGDISSNSRKLIDILEELGLCVVKKKGVTGINCRNLTCFDEEFILKKECKDSFDEFWKQTFEGVDQNILEFIKENAHQSSLLAFGRLFVQDVSMIEQSSRWINIDKMVYTEFRYNNSSDFLVEFTNRIEFFDRERKLMAVFIFKGDICKKSDNSVEFIPRSCEIIPYDRVFIRDMYNAYNSQGRHDIAMFEKIENLEYASYGILQIIGVFLLVAINNIIKSFTREQNVTSSLTSRPS